MLRECKRKLSEEQLKKIDKHGILSIFSQAELIGYGIYRERIVEIGGEKYVVYMTSDSCD